MAFEPEVWEGEHSRMLIYPRQPAGLWHSTDSLLPLPPPPIIVSLEGIPDQFVYTHCDIMASDNFEQLDASEVKADHNSHPFMDPYTPQNFQEIVRLPP
jgi:hypothetical protein